MIVLAFVAAAAAVLVFPVPRASAMRVRAALPTASDIDSEPVRLATAVRQLRPRAEPLGLAAAWDLLAACLRAGMPVPDALGAIAGAVPVAAAQALRRTGELIALGAAPDEAWRPALDCAATAPLARAARRTARSGSALAGAAADLAARARAELAESAQERAQRAGVLITVPLGLCFLPAFLLLGVVPVVIGLANRLTVTS